MAALQGVSPVTFFLLIRFLPHAIFPTCLLQGSYLDLGIMTTLDTYGIREGTQHYGLTSYLK